MTLLQEAHALPERPGIYKMFDARDQIIYVGKAKSLKARVTSYFLKSTPHTVKIKQMITRIAYFQTVEVASEFDALLLECQLIHRYRPPYNKMMNHYEEYAYFQLAQGQLKIITEWSDRGQIFGPFFKKARMVELLAVIISVYRLNGPLKFAAGIVAPYPEVVTDADRKDEYAARLAEISDMLTGANQMILKRLDDKVAQFSAAAHFEQADSWWQKRDVVQRFLRRNHSLLAASQHHYFLGKLPLTTGTRYYLYFQDEVVAATTYLKKVSDEQALKKLARAFSRQERMRLEEKQLLTKADADVFPIFFNYLNRHGEILPVELPK